ncbi:MAG: hypothetical protein ACLSSX_08565, partial [Dysosmobacter sp.]
LPICLFVGCSFQLFCSSLDGTDLLSSDSDIWIEEDGTTVEMNPPTTRIGLSESQERLLRFSAKSFTFE